MKHPSYVATCPISVIESLVKSSDTFIEVAQKLGYTNKGGAYRTLRKRIEKHNIDCSHMTHIGKKHIAKKVIIVTSKEALVENSPYSQSTIRAVVARENLIEYKCSICGLEAMWNNKPLTLTLDHINGNNKDNRLENLRYVCPNCDRQLDTFGAKNKRSYYKFPVVKNKNKCIKCGKPIENKSTLCKECLIKQNREHFLSKDEMNEIIKVSPSIVQLSKYLKLSDNGARKRLKYYNIPFDSKGYRIYRSNLIIGK